MPAQARLRRTCARRANFRRSSSVARPQNFALVCFCPLLYYSQNLGTTVIQKSFLIPASLMMRLHSLSRGLFWLFSEGSEILYPELSPPFSWRLRAFWNMATVDYGRYTAAWLYGQVISLLYEQRSNKLSLSLLFLFYVLLEICQSYISCISL